ncbi:YcaO-like family protein [Streptomyces sp. NPDC001286]
MPKTVTTGTHRIIAPEETWARVRPLLPRMGITRVADVTGLDTVGIPVFQAVRPNARTLSVSQGKGVSPELARISGVMESIETWHAEEESLPAVQASVAEMESGLSYSTFDLCRPHRSVLSRETRLEWIAATSLAEAGATWVPRSYVRMDGTDPGSWAPPLLRCTSNGLASGNTLEEALLHGMYEVLERDAEAKAARHAWGPVLNPESLTGTLAALMEKFLAADIEVRIHDLTAYSGLPCYKAFIWSRDLPIVCAGSGCHIDSEVSLSRALTEAAQARVTLIAGTREDIPQDSYRRMSDQSSLRSPLGSTTPDVEFSNNNSSFGEFSDDMHHVTQIVAKRAIGDVFWVNLSRGTLQIPVVKVVAPGLELL